MNLLLSAAASRSYPCINYEAARFRLGHGGNSKTKRIGTLSRNNCACGLSIAHVKRGNLSESHSLTKHERLTDSIESNRIKIMLNDSKPINDIRGKNIKSDISKALTIWSLPAESGEHHLACEETSSWNRDESSHET